MRNAAERAIQFVIDPIIWRRHVLSLLPKPKPTHSLFLCCSVLHLHLPSSPSIRHSDPFTPSSIPHHLDNSPSPDFQSWITSSRSSDEERRPSHFSSLSTPPSPLVTQIGSKLERDFHLDITLSTLLDSEFERNPTTVELSVGALTSARLALTTSLQSSNFSNCDLCRLSRTFNRGLSNSSKAPQWQ